MKETRPLPDRPGPRPRATRATPHRQLDQISPIELQERLWQAMAGLPDITTGPSGISVPGTRALCLQGCGHPRAFMIGREFAHLHPAQDGSLHMTLDPDSHTQALAGGWAEPHPLAGRFAPSTTVLVYGPRDDAEWQVVWWLVQQSWRYASAQDPIPFSASPSGATH